MNIKIVIGIIIAVIVIAFAFIKNYTESRTDDVEKEIKKVSRKNKQSYTLNSSPEKAEYTSEAVKEAAYKLYKKPIQFWKSLEKENKKLILFVCALVGIAAFGFITIMSVTDYDTPVEENYFYGGFVMPDGYKTADYNIVGSNTIFDTNGITVSIEGFYDDRYLGEGRGEPIIYYTVKNRSSSDVSISFDIIGVNGSCGESYQRTVERDLFSDESESVISYIFTGVNWEIKEIIFSHLTITDMDSGEYIYGGKDEEYENLFRFTTDSDEEIYTDPWEEEPIYDENEVKIYKSGTRLCIENNSKHDFSVNAYALSENQQTEDTICGDMLLPYGYSMNFELSGDYDMFDMDEGRVSFFFEFDCKDAPSESFKTGSIK